MPLRFRGRIRLVNIKLDPKRASKTDAVIDLDATALDAAFSDFFVFFEDNGDGLLQVNEITQFSGVDVHSLDAFYDQLVAVPTIPDISSNTRRSI